MSLGHRRAERGSIMLFPPPLFPRSEARLHIFFFFSSRRRHTRFKCDWSSDVCSSDLIWRAGVVITGVGGCVAAVGFEAAKRLAPALGAAVFLIPVDPYGRIRFAVPLQTAAAGITQWICDVLGMYVDRARNLLTINGVEVNV